MTRRLCFLCLFLLSFPCPALHADLVAANVALQEGRVAESTSLLQAWLAQHPSDGAAHLLLCRTFYVQRSIDPAVSECEAAASDSPTSSQAQLWLGRAYGMKASAANPLVAFAIARKVRDAFERAVRLDPGSVPAMSDLGEYYVEAPAIVGGGVGKARALSDRLQTFHQPAYSSLSHRILALLAEKADDTATAESEFRAATAGNAPNAWIDLAAFYARHAKPDQAVANVSRALAVNNVRGEILVDAASVLTEADRDRDHAVRLLRDYLASPARTDAQPAFKVRLQLGRLLANSGDLAGAQREYAAALALAPNFPPAQKAAAADPRSTPRSAKP